MGMRQLFGDDLALQQHGIPVSANFMFLDTIKEIWKLFVILIS